MNRRDLLASAALAAATTTASGDESSPADTAATTSATPGRRASVRDCVALVTGSNRGVGLGFVEVLLERGAKKVYATARKQQYFPELVALDPDRVVPLLLDVNEPEHRGRAAAAATDVTWLINNAAYPGSREADERRVLSASSLDDCKQVMQTNCWSPAELARLFAPIIVANGGGAIANVLSAASWFCLPEYTAYSISKAAAMMMTAGIRAELAREPVLVASVFTGGVDTRASPAGSYRGVTPRAHAREVFDAMERGDTDVYAAGSRTMRERIMADPVAFERGRIERFWDDPLVIRNHL
jgi:NAD(P)-dependent dehydrogenase (short-subunit alcohol dehydrogenase family)